MKRDFKFTDDLWFNTELSVTGNTIVKGSKTGATIVEMLAPYHQKNEEEVSTDFLEEKANLKLIQHAPLMLKALERVEEIVESVINRKISVFDVNVKDELLSITKLLNKIEEYSD